MRIIQLMKEVKMGNMSVRFPENRSDEMGYLGSAFNSMVYRVSEMLEINTKLNKEIYESKYLQKEAQLKALNSQIRPHFIYNTLNTISLLIQVGEDEAAVENIDRMSLILRGVANINKEIVLKSEIELLEAYLFIQKTRYKERLEYSIEIDEKIFNFLIPAFTLQPLVENSVVHGCERRKTTTHIHIYSEQESELLSIFIEDDAMGMDEKRLIEMKEKLENGAVNTFNEENHSVMQGGIGMINVNRRIKLLYGDAYGLFLHSRSGVLIVEVRFPYIKNRT
jgi:two-component system sensor histidine kinase YesM